MRRAIGIAGVVWTVLMALHQVVVGMGVTTLPGPWRHECHFRRQCHPDRPNGLPEWRKKVQP